MKALVFEEPRRAVVSDFETPAIAADEVLVRSRNVGICHSDFELYEGRYIIPVSYPIIPGHEWSGEIAEVGGAVTTLQRGDRVVGECVVNNGDDHFGFSISGANAEYFVAKASWLHRIPDELSFQQGAFVEPFSVAYAATVAAGGIDASDEVAVIGGGPIGLLCVMAAASMGGSVTLIEPQPHRRTLGLEVGASRAIDPGAAPLAEQAGEVTGSRGLRRGHRSCRGACRHGERPPDRRARRATRLRGHRCRRNSNRRDRARAIKGTAGPRDHRLGRAVAAHDPLHGHERVDPTPLLTARFPLARRARGPRGGARHEPQREGSDRVLTK